MDIISIWINGERPSNECIASQNALEGNHIFIDPIESRQLLNDALKLYDSPHSIDAFFNFPAWVIADYVRVIYLSMHTGLYLDWDVEIVNPTLFLTQLKDDAMEEKPTKLYNTGIIYNKRSCSLFDNLCAYWLRQPIHFQMFSATGWMALQHGFLPIHYGFIHHEYSLKGVAK